MSKNVKQPSAGQLQILTRLYSQGALAEASAQGEALAKTFPQSPVLSNLLGAIYAGLGQQDKAAQNFKKAILLKPDYAEAYNNLGSVQFNSGDHGAAIKSYEQAVKIKPGYRDAHRNMGNAHLARSHFPAALRSFREAVRLNPQDAEAHVGLGAALLVCNNPSAALASYRKALDIQPDHVAALVNMGVAQQAMDDIDGAIESYRKALALKPAHAEAHNNLGSVLREIGDIESALFHSQEAVRIKPDYAGAYRNLSLISKCQPGDERIERMRALVNAGKLSDRDMCQICFALGKAYEDIGDVTESFAWLVRGNALRKQELKFDISAEQKLFALIKESFSGNIPEVEEENNEKTPVFIVGMPRSGTSLVEQILSSHSRIYGAGELDFMRQAVTASGWPNRKPGREELLQLRRHYLGGLQALNVTEPYITDKMPINFRWIGFILSALPGAKIAHIKRDARATCWSIFKQYFVSSSNGYAYNLDDLAVYYRLYTDIMSFWHDRYPGRIYDLSYEQLTEDQEAETRKLLAYAGLEWEEGCLAFHENKRTVRTASALQVRQNMYRGSSDVWKKYAELLGSSFKALEGL